MMLTPDEYMSIMRLIRSERESEGASLSMRDNSPADKPKRKRKTAYQRKYKANFKKIANRYKLKSGKWKKGGFKAAVKMAHKMTKK